MKTKRNWPLSAGGFHYKGAAPSRPIRVTDGRSTYLVTDRDLSILRALEDFRILSLEQIWAAFFCNDKPLALQYLFNQSISTKRGCANAAYQRLASLVRAGCIEHNYRRHCANIYRLASAGQNLLRSCGATGYKRLARWPNNDRHTLMVSGAGLYFSRILGLEVASERKLWVTDRKAGAGYTEAGEPIADLKITWKTAVLRVEMELTEKHQERYQSLWKKLGDKVRSSDPVVLYMVEDRNLKSHLLRIAKSQYFPGIYIANIEDLCANWPDAVWRNFEGKDFRFSGLPAGPVGREQGSATSLSVPGGPITARGVNES